MRDKGTRGDTLSNIGDTSKRLNRRFLLIVGSVVGGSWIAGCMKLLSDNERASSEGEGTNSSQGQGRGQDQGATPTPNQTEDGGENNTERKDERQRTPSEEDTAINRSQYNETEPQEVEERPESDVTVETEQHISSDGSVTVRGEVTNTSSQTIDFVDVELTYLNKVGEPIGTAIKTVWDLEPGASASFIVSQNPVDLRGGVDDVKTTAYPQDYVESESSTNNES